MGAIAEYRSRISAIAMLQRKLAADLAQDSGVAVKKPRLCNGDSAGNVPKHKIRPIAKVVILSAFLKW